jgi:branched-subunit amino acid aminotransferase/4-amino-4-deoxychorismate lyase
MTTTTPTSTPNQRFVSINGKVIDCETTDAAISIFDTSILRGDGVFEVMRVVVPTKREEGPQQGLRSELPYIHSLSRHLQRLEISATAVGCPLPDFGLVRMWLEEAATAFGHFHSDGIGGGSGGYLRLIATKGEQEVTIPPSVIIMSMPLAQWPDTFTLLPLIAPWHPAGLPGWEIPIKWTSYGPNVVSANKARKAGFTDSLLLSPHRVTVRSSNDEDSNTNDKTFFNEWANVPLQEYHVLDGPNFAVAWIQERTTGGNINADGHDDDTTRNDITTLSPILYIPCSTTLGLLPSITQAWVVELAQKELGWEVQYGVFTFGQLLDTADEVIVMSTTRGVKAVTKIGDYDIVSSVRRTTGMDDKETSSLSRTIQLSLLLERDDDTV